MSSVWKIFIIHIQFNRLVIQMKWKKCVRFFSLLRNRLWCSMLCVRNWSSIPLHIIENKGVKKMKWVHKKSERAKERGPLCIESEWEWYWNRIKMIWIERNTRQEEKKTWHTIIWVDLSHFIMSSTRSAHGARALWYFVVLIYLFFLKSENLIRKWSNSLWYQCILCSSSLTSFSLRFEISMCVFFLSVQTGDAP